jgi:shikimate dehydrogenase
MTSSSIAQANESRSSSQKKVFLLGKNISESISPLLQNAAFEKLGIKARYELHELNHESLEQFVSSAAKSNEILGFNVTSPFKEEITRLLSNLDTRSKAIGAVNTVKVSKRRLMQGFNTDYDGVIATLKKLGAMPTIKKKRAVVIGAGGASRACIFALLEVGYNQISILNRTLEKAESISKHFGSRFPHSKIDALPLTKGNLSKSLENSRVVINAISSSDSKVFPVELDFSYADQDTRFFDLGYKGESMFFANAKKNRFKAVNGSIMILTAAERSFEIWTGRKAPVKTMELEAKKALRNLALSKKKKEKEFQSIS